MNHDISALWGERQNTVHEMRNFVDAIGERAFSAEETATYERYNKAIDAIDERITRATELNKRTNEVNAIIGDGRGDVRGSTSAALAEALGAGTDQSRSILLGGEERDLTTGTSNALIVEEFSDQLISVKSEASPIWANGGRSVNVAHSRKISYPKLSAYGSAAFISEGGALSESDPTVNSISLEAFKVGKATQVSPEAEHEFAAVLDTLFLDMEVSVAVAIDVQLHGGDGTTEPQGLTVGFTNTSTIPGVSDPTSDSLIDAVHAIAPAYRQTGDFVFTFNDSVMLAIRQLKDTTNQYLWRPGLEAGAPDTLLGYPVFTDENWANVGANAKIGAFYDRNSFLIRKSPTRVDRSLEYAFLNDLITYRTLTWTDSQVTDVAAGVILENEAS